MKTEKATVTEVRAKCFVAVPEGTNDQITCHFDARRHLEPGLSQPLFSSVKRSVADGDVKVGAKVMLRRRDNDPFRASHWETLEAYQTADGKRKAAFVASKQQLLPIS